MTKLWITALMTLSVTAQAKVIDLITTTEQTIDGKVVTFVQDSFHRSLYTFDIDQNGKSACNAKCAEDWPPYSLTKGETNNLVEPLGFIVRDNGKFQLTYHGHPVYTFYQDRLVSDFLGDGVGGVWHSVVAESIQQ